MLTGRLIGLVRNECLGVGLDKIDDNICAKIRGRNLFFQTVFSESYENIDQLRNSVHGDILCLRYG